MITQISTIWSDIDQRLEIDGRGEIKIAINVESVMTSIDNILRTYKGERVMLPEFGSMLQNIVFESMDEDLIDFISRDIKDLIEIWDDRISVQEVSFSSSPDENAISLQLKLRIRGYNQIFKYVRPINGVIDND